MVRMAAVGCLPIHMHTNVGHAPTCNMLARVMCEDTNDLQCRTYVIHMGCLSLHMHTNVYGMHLHVICTCIDMYIYIHVHISTLQRTL